MQPSLQKNLPENLQTVSLKSFVVGEKNQELVCKGEVQTPAVLVENIDSPEENVFWVNITNLWVLIGRVPPLVVEMDDIVIFKEKGKWGLFRFVGKEKDEVILTDGMRRKKTRVKTADFFKLNLLGKVLRVQQKL